MYIGLSTAYIWQLKAGFRPERFLRALRVILQDGDVLVTGAYCPSPRLLGRMRELGATLRDDRLIYEHSFGANRSSYPNGRPFELVVTSRLLETLAQEAERNDGQTDIDLFYDHVIAYRRGLPVVPLFSFHDACTGGDLYLTGLYSEREVRELATRLGCEMKGVQNFEFRHVFVKASGEEVLEETKLIEGL